MNLVDPIYTSVFSVLPAGGGGGSRLGGTSFLLPETGWHVT